MQEDHATTTRNEPPPTAYLDRPIGLWPTELIDEPIPYRLSHEAGAAFEALDATGMVP